MINLLGGLSADGVVATSSGRELLVPEMECSGIWVLCHEFVHVCSVSHLSVSLHLDRQQSTE